MYTTDVKMEDEIGNTWLEWKIKHYEDQSLNTERRSLPSIKLELSQKVKRVNSSVTLLVKMMRAEQRINTRWTWANILKADLSRQFLWCTMGWYKRGKTVLHCRWIKGWRAQTGLYRPLKYMFSVYVYLAQWLGSRPSYPPFWLHPYI